MRKLAYELNKCIVFEIILEQCTAPLQAKLCGLHNRQTIFSNKDLVELLKSVKIWMLNQQGSRCPVSVTTMSIASSFK